MDSKSIVDLPNQVIEGILFVFLSRKDIKAFGMTGNKRFKEIAEEALRKMRK